MARLLEREATVKLGFLVDLRHLGDRRTMAAHAARTIELIVEAEVLGADAVWFSEHHGLCDGYLPQPLVFAAAVAARTNRMRIGTGVTLPALRHTRHIAEEASLVDLISNGRLELGFGAGYGPGEFEAFNVSFRDRFSATHRAVEEVRRLFGDGTVTPQPAQEQIPIWLGHDGPKGARKAGLLGCGLLSLDRAAFDYYKSGLVESNQLSQARVGGLLDIVVADDPEKAIARLLPHWLHQQNTYRSLMRQPDGASLKPLDLTRARATLAQTGRLGRLRVLSVNDTIEAVATAIDGLPVEHLYTWLSVADMPTDLVGAHLNLWCGPVRSALT